MQTKTLGAAGPADCWAPIPGAIHEYVQHVEDGVPIRQIARREGIHPSTVQRRIRRVESMRDDVLYDAAVARVCRDATDKRTQTMTSQEANCMTALRRCDQSAYAEETLEREARRILRRLSEPGACRAYAVDMEKAVVVRETAEGRTVRTAVTDREAAQAMALRDWLVCTAPGRVSRYRITSAGRAALKRLLAEDEARGRGFAEAAAPFGDQHRDWEERDFPVAGSSRTVRMRYNASESPIAAMSRRKGKDGEPFLNADLVSAAERLREDFELSQMGPRVAQNWEKFLSGGDHSGFVPGSGGGGSEAARGRVMAAVKELGPGLGDVALRVCCFLEGLESAEKRLGWSARSGKIVLRIALQRLAKHYGTGGQNDMIG